MSSRNKSKSLKQKNAAEPVKKELPDTQPGMVTCPGCGNKFKEYEYFCPFCKKPVE